MISDLSIFHYFDTRVLLLGLNHFLSFSLFFLVPQPDPNTPKPEGRQIIPVKGEPLGVVSNWPPALQAALARWGATQAKSPALTVLDITGKPLYTLTYGGSQPDKPRRARGSLFSSLTETRSVACEAVRLK